VIAIFFGVETPFLLRPIPGSENKFRLLEEASMEDCMKGEKTGGDNFKRIFLSYVKSRSIFLKMSSCKIRIGTAFLRILEVLG
jgi:hypothetical protein